MPTSTSDISLAEAEALLASLSKRHRAAVAMKDGPEAAYLHGRIAQTEAVIEGYRSGTRSERPVRKRKSRKKRTARSTAFWVVLAVVATVVVPVVVMLLME